MLTAVVAFSVVGGGVAIQAQRAQEQHRLDEIRAAFADAQDEHRVLRAAVAFAESPDRIMAEAREMGMVEPAPVLPLASVSGSSQPTADEGATPR